jgi:hypothetical protein
MAAGVTDRIMKEDAVSLIDAANPIPAVQGPYKKRGICIHCQHPIGYHHLEGDKCSCKDCACPGYEGYQAAEISNWDTTEILTVLLFRLLFYKISNFLGGQAMLLAFFETGSGIICAALFAECFAILKAAPDMWLGVRRLGGGGRENKESQKNRR